MSDSRPIERGPIGRLAAQFSLPEPLAHLRQALRWVGWKWTQKPDGAWDKPPYRAAFPDFHASTTNPKTWAMLDTAERALAAGNIDGIGYVIREDAEHVFLDLDDCRDPITGEIADWANSLVEECDSYTELTPSGAGLRIIGTHGGFLSAPIDASYRLPCGGHGEVYFRGIRYVTMTGLHLAGTPTETRDIGGAALELLARAGRKIGPQAQAKATTPEQARAPMRDVLAALATIRNEDLEYDEWLRIGLATFSATAGEGEGLEAWMRWSAKSGKHHDHECMRAWNSFHKSPPRSIGFGSLAYLARSANPMWAAPSWRGEPPPDDRPEAPPHDAHPDYEGAQAHEGAHEGAQPKTSPLWVDADEWDPATIPKRPWVVPGYFMRGAVSILSGQGAGGKSSLVVCWTVAGGTGQAVGEFRPNGALIMVNYNVEDECDEQRRRYTAALMATGITPAAIANRVIRCGPHDVGTLFERDNNTGRILPTLAMNALERLLMETQADVLICDPLAELHNAEENDNTAMRSVIAAFRSMAKRLDIAVMVLHHDRKGNNAPGDMDRMRGASAVSGAVRVALTLSTMSQEEADKFGIAPEDRKRHFRVDGAKSNYAPAQDAEWWRLDGMDIANGETVAACRPWAPPSMFDGLSTGDCVAVLEAMNRGTPDGFAYAVAKKTGEDWAGSLLVAKGRNDIQAGQILAVWTKEKAITVEELPSPRRGHKRQGYTVNMEAVSGMRREIRGNQA